MTATTAAETTTPGRNNNTARPITAMQMQQPTFGATTAMTATGATMDLAETKEAVTTKHFLPRILKSIQNSQPMEMPTSTETDMDYLPASVPVTTAKAPLFEVKLQLLLGSKINFEPTFASNVANNFQGIVQQLLNDIKLACDGIPRVFHDKATRGAEQPALSGKKYVNTLYGVTHQTQSAAP